MANLIRFLYPQVPQHDEDLDHTWENREREIAQAEQKIRAALASPPGVPLAIVGGARVGKSHLLRKVERLVRNGVNASINVRIVSDQTDDRAVVVEILEQVVDGLRAKLPPHKPRTPSPLAPLDEILSRFAGVISGHDSEVSVTWTQSLTKAYKLALAGTGGAKAKGGTWFSWLVSASGEVNASGTVSGEGARTSSNTEARTVKVSRLDADMITRLIVVAHRLVRHKNADWKTLIVVDDFDLLKRRADDALDPVPLLSALRTLSVEPGITVLTTVREDTFERHQKDLYRLTKVGPFETEAPLMAIYQKHVTHWNDDLAPFQDSFAHAAARASLGRVGLFLKLLHDAFDRYGDDQSLTWHGYMEREWRDVQDTVPEMAEELRQLVRGHAGLVPAEKLPAVRSSVAFRWIMEEYSSTNAFRVHPALRAFLIGQNLDPRPERR